MKRIVEGVKSFVSVLFEPVSLFNKLIEKPKNFYPFILIMLIGIFLVLSTSQFIIQEISHLFELEEKVSNSAIIIGIFSFIISGGLLIEWLIQAIVIYFMVSLFSTETREFRAVSSIIGYSWVPIAIKVISFSLLVMFSGELYEIKGFSGILKDTDNSLLNSFLKNIDFFVIWQYIILYLGVKILIRDSSKWMSIMIITFTFLLNTILKIIPEFFTSFM
ncbi:MULTISPECIES: YIP1 family protein [Bacillus]|uniref:YIP1 family protein n=1 Tax=Bacillus TaxID=1386 RepID=UPI0016710EF9|nr:MULTISPECIES: YIP1 family protein [Bacillus]MDF9458985.1 YIP1 family protein [Bacillus pumilus]QZD59866.1 YIP1 family protein [Bacillus pumilus]WOP22339.1 YIP1 family protein [Bacillus pumilus]